MLLWNVWVQVEAARQRIAEPGPFTAGNLGGAVAGENIYIETGHMKSVAGKNDAGGICMKTNPLLKLERLGQSIWMDFIRRGMISSGAGRHDSDDAIRALALEGKSVEHIQADRGATIE